MDIDHERLWIGIIVLQRFGREGTIIADRLLNEMPIESPEYDRDCLILAVQRQLLKDRDK